MDRPSRKITIIPATKGNAMLGPLYRQLRVAAYCRVSTDTDEQLGSFETQKEYYADLIMRNTKWSMAGIYADEGISGGKAENRPDFQRMLRHCKQGKIDLVITKSISRFARNTVDSIKTVRELKAMGITVIFEKENINTMEENTELVFTMLSGMAQQELESLSQNVRNGKNMRAKNGNVAPMLERLYGYRKAQNGEYEIIDEQAEVVKRIYRHYLMGYTDVQISQELNSQNINRKNEKSKWSAGTVQSILTNEKYCGDIVYPKTIVTDPISKRIVKNNGEYMQVLITDNHDGIVSHEIFRQAQDERARRNSRRKVSDKTITEQGKYSSMYALTDILICGYCGTPYRRVTWKISENENKAVWRCVNRLDHGKKYCTESVSIDETILHKTIVKAIKTCTDDKSKLIPLLGAHIEKAMWQTAGGKINIAGLERRMEQLKKDTMELLSSSVANNTVAANEGKLHAMNEEIRELHKKLEEYKDNKDAKVSINGKLKEYIDYLQIDTQSMDVYDDNIVRQLIHTINVTKGYIHIHFKDGSEWRQPMEPKIRKPRKK